MFESLGVHEQKTNTCYCSVMGRVETMLACANKLRFQHRRGPAKMPITAPVDRTRVLYGAGTRDGSGGANAAEFGCNAGLARRARQRHGALIRWVPRYSSIA